MRDVPNLHFVTNTDKKQQQAFRSIVRKLFMTPWENVKKVSQ